MDKYSSYKDSGVEWMGEIPNSWFVGKLGFYSRVFRGSGYQFLIQVDEDSDIKKEKVLRISDFNEFNPIWCEYIEQFENYRIQEGDILVGGTGHYFGRNMYVTDEMIGLIHSYNIIRLVVNKQNSKYLSYWLSNKLIREQMDISVLGSGQPFIDTQGLKDLKILIPPLTEQQKIVEFLDDKTTKIDNLIQHKEKKIELLKEKRTSLINHVVTKGLNPDVEFKDSGIEWIGEIPSHWVINKVGNNTYVKGRIGWKGLRSEDFIEEGPYLITGTDFLKDGKINWDNMYHVSQERYDEDPFIQLQDEDVLITKDGTIGKVVHVGNLKGQTCLNSGIFLTRPTNNQYKSRYFFWVLNSNVFKVFVDYNSGGSTIQHLYQNVFVNFKFPIPPLEEQEIIINYIDEQTNEIDDLIQLEQKKIELLKEYRQSLISEVVTGKVRVCEEDLSETVQTV